ncbi:glutamate 5-kinase [Emticicia sp. CRIBPO]|uniref:glutamate 5-kinase n=1 Tax=Emticicia sp. CRIBPO TaxID=2683258 RepID=UPI001412A280|nr:glutamate 5-kinase [Emticicia sp. CRIBPO]NBA85339.1 glutamate 5-kinase [Emticicia sp. CRIBPO]
MKKDLIVIKFGTASITKPNGEPDQNIIADIAEQVAELAKKNRIVIVSSGAVGAGKHFIKNYEGEISQRKAAAAIGNPLLLSMYSQHFAKFGTQVAQSLCERQHFANRGQFLQLKETYQELWKNNIIPIANENDVVSNRELRFSDNDELATLIAGGFGASVLMICTVAGGLLDKEKKVVPEIKSISEDIIGLVDSSKSSLGLGGMASKLTFTKLATKMGIKVIIFGMAKPQGIPEALSQNSGSTFLPETVKLSARNKWLASGGLSVGKLMLDSGASKAILSRKSLLAVGIKSLEGDFGKGEVVELLDDKLQVIAVARVRESSEALKDNPKTQNLVVAHADDIVML